MSQCKFGLILLAAGKGTRLRVDTPKPLLKILGRPLGVYPLVAGQELLSELDEHAVVSIVVGHEKERVIDELGQCISELNHLRPFFATQAEQKGTGHAVQMAFEQCPELMKCDHIFITCADTPSIRAHHFKALIDQKGSSSAVVASFTQDSPAGMGRIIKGEGKGIQIIEEKDASEGQKAIKEVNSGLYLVDTAFLVEKSKGLKSENAAGEFYLTDIFTQDQDCKAVHFDDGDSFRGVNDLVQWSEAFKSIQSERNQQLLLEGVFIPAPELTHIDWNCSVEANSYIEAGVKIENSSQVGAFCQIGSGVQLSNTIIESGVKLLPYSVISDSIVREKASIGPMAHLRPKTDIGAECKVGNFVETKKTTLHKGAKASHLSYIGDAVVGENSNLGCGLITCNYDGENKHQTIIGKNCFIGSDTQLVAPLNIGDDCFVASGSTINKDLTPGSFAISRGRQVNKEGMAKRFLKGMKKD